MSKEIFSQIMLQRESFNYDIDNITLQSGLYSINKDVVLGNTVPGINYGLLLVFNGNRLSNGGSPILQIAVSNDSTVKFRFHWINSWRDWIQFTTK